MAIAKLAQKIFQGVHATAYAKTLKAKVDEVIDLLNTLVVGSAGFLSADDAGRAVMAAGYFSEATATAKFAAGAIVGTLLKAGALAATTQGRALIATGYFDEATATDKFAAQAITGALLKNATVTATQLAGTLCGAPTDRSGPGACAITSPYCLLTTTGTGDALTVADGGFAGQTLTIRHIVDGGTGVITQTTGAKLRSDITTITFTNVGDWVTLVWTGTLWTPVQGSGVTIATS